MRDKKRIKRILKLLEELWLEHSQERLGQILENYIFVKGDRGDKTSVMLFYQEDDYTEAILMAMRALGK